MTSMISKDELERICAGISDDRETIIRHNPIGNDNEVMLWMLLNCLNSYLSLSPSEEPCFNGVPDEKTYHEAILFVLRDRTSDSFDPRPIIDKLLKDVR